MCQSQAMPPAVLVRPAQEADLDEVGRMSLAAYNAAGQLEPGSTYGATLADAAARHRDAEVLVAERDGTIVGTVTICPRGSSFAEIGRPGELEFRFLAVDPGAWGGGVADALVAACEERARERGVTRLAICVRDTNTGAAAMYAKRGFTRVPERDWSPVPGTNLLVLTRPVAAAP